MFNVFIDVMIVTENILYVERSVKLCWTVKSVSLYGKISLKERMIMLKRSFYKKFAKSVDAFELAMGFIVIIMIAVGIWSMFAKFVKVFLDISYSKSALLTAGLIVSIFVLKMISDKIDKMYTIGKQYIEEDKEMAEENIDVKKQ